MLPTLYKKTKTGAIQQWSVSTYEDVITVEQGQVGGAMQQYLTYCTGKNFGKANETSPIKQAVLEAQSKWEKQCKKGYVEDQSGEVVVKLPMKVKVYQDNIKNVKFPCIVEYKLDGVNATVRLIDDKLIWTSRGGESYPTPTHLTEQVKEIMHRLLTSVLAGELYIHGEHLQNIQSAVKKHNELTPSLRFYIFDMPDATSKAVIRKALISAITDDTIQNEIANSHDDIETMHTKAVSDGYEGIVIYNQNGLYQYNTRSSDVFKYKKSRDAEYLIIDYVIDKNRHPIFICQAGADANRTFKVKPTGTDEERKMILSTIEQYIGKWYTVAYEQLSVDLIPLKPRGIGLRDCNLIGEPIE